MVGVSIAAFDRIEQRIECRSVFADLHHSWRRGSIDNTDGLVRDYAPKRFTLSALSALFDFSPVGFGA